MTKPRSRFGALRQLPSGRWQAKYTDPAGVMRPAPATFDTKRDAEAWLAGVRADLTRGEWKPTAGRRPVTFGEYSALWLAERPLKPRTAEHYAKLIERHLAPTFGPLALMAITPEVVRRWYAATATKTPTLRAHAYSLLKTILASAINEDVIGTANPCRIRGAGQSKRARDVQPASLDELAVLVAAMPERYRLMTLLAAWCAPRFGELTELRRSDVDLKNGRLCIRRGVSRTKGQVHVGDPKSEAGDRSVAIPPHLMPLVRDHLAATISGGDGLLFTSGTGARIGPSTLYKSFYPAREQAGRPDLRWHDLRHTGAVLAASTGASLAELMARLGHSTPGAALRYQHAAKGRDAEIARALSELAAARR